MPRQGSRAKTADASQGSRAARQALVGRGEASEGVAAIFGASANAQKPRKYGNVKAVADGITFDSKKEAARYAELMAAQLVGDISHLEVHPRFPLVVHGVDCGVYVGDFSYIGEGGRRVVEDVKSAATRKLPTYRLKRRMVWALYGITIQEV